jgi:hypothetical protein
VEVFIFQQRAATGEKPVASPWRGLLAFCCIAGPFVAIIVLGIFYTMLISPALFQDSAKLTFQYTAATPDDAVVAEKTTQANSDETSVKPDATMFLPARDYAGHAAYAIASAFLAIIVLTTFIFSAALVFQSWRWTGVIALGVAWYFSDVHGRYLVVRDLLNQADSFAGLAPFVTSSHGRALPTGQLMENLIFANTVLALIPIGMLLTALFLLTRRSQEPIETPALIARRLLLRCLLWLASASFVMGVVCNKALVEWPLTLVKADQALALTPVANSLVLQFGALGTAAIFAAFLPAVAAWMLDANALREKIQSDGQPAAAQTDALEFATMPAITSVMAVIAPLLTSPVVDSFRSVLGALSK